MKLSLVIMSLFLSATVFAGTQQMEDFGDNPGALQASLYSPEGDSKALLVLLHGCAQNGEWLAEHTGLMAAAKARQFALLLPQQDKANNMQLCFNWFSPDDQLAGKGETASLMNMIASAKAQTKTDTVYIVGLSAGGAMATSIVAQYPEEFTAAGIIAGVGYPCADNLVKALSCMKTGSSYPVEQLAERVKSLHEKAVSWPDMVVISGSDDTIVSAKNSEQIVAQWQLITGAKSAAAESEQDAPVSISTLTNNDTKTYVELVMIKGLGHGWPVKAESEYPGKAAPFILESALNTTDYLLKKWQL